jgi:hypothetical protein
MPSLRKGLNAYPSASPYSIEEILKDDFYPE